MTYTIKLRRSLASDWTAVNPVLSEGEFGYELDTRNFKIGDGLSAWNVLEYVIDENDRMPDASLLDDGEILITFGGNWVVLPLPSGLPDASGVPDGKMLATFGEEWIIVDPPEGGTVVPDPSGEADGRMLVVASGALVYADAPEGGGPSVTSYLVTAYIDEAVGPGAGTQRFYNPAGVDLNIVSVTIGFSVAPTGTGTEIFDTNVDGTTIFTDQSHRPTFSNGEYVKHVTVIDDPSWPAASYISHDVDDILATTTGSIVTITVLAVPA